MDKDSERAALDLAASTMRRLGMVPTDDDTTALRHMLREELRESAKPLERELKTLNGRLDRFSTKMERIDTELGRLRQEAGGLRIELNGLRSDAGTFHREMDAFREDTQQNFDALLKRDETREQENLVIRHQLEQLEEKVA